MNTNTALITRVIRDLTKANLAELRLVATQMVLAYNPDLALTLFRTLEHFVEAEIELATQDKTKDETPEVSYRVHLVNNGLKKIAVIKELRVFFGLGLKGAKQLADMAPIILPMPLTEDMAMRLLDALKGVGAEAFMEEMPPE